MGGNEGAADSSADGAVADRGMKGWPCDWGLEGSCFLGAVFRLPGTAATLGAVGRFAFSGALIGRGPNLTFGLNSASYWLKSYGSSSIDCERINEIAESDCRRGGNSVTLGSGKLDWGSLCAAALSLSWAGCGPGRMVSDSDSGDSVIRDTSAEASGASVVDRVRSPFVGSDGDGSTGVKGSDSFSGRDETGRSGGFAGDVLGLSECSEVMERCARFPMPRSALYLCGPDKLAEEALALLEPSCVPSSSSSSRSSSRRPADGDGEAVCR